MNMQDAIRTVITGADLSYAQTTEVFTEIMSGKATDAQIAALIVALRMKGESPDEITGAASVMRHKATHVLPLSDEHIVDTCGTGGDGANTFNISTATALVAAGAGAIVAKHGNRSVSSKCGSADVLEALGVSITINPEEMKKCLDEVGIAFLFAPTLHNAMKYAITPRKEIGIRTIFNILGPLTNPSFAKRQILGVFSPELTETMATVLKNMGSEHAYVVHGLDRLDEISISAATRVSEVLDGTIRTYDIEPEDFGISRSPLTAISGGTPEENAVIIRSIINDKENSARSDIVVLNAAFAICAAGITATPMEGICAARESINSGAAAKKLEQLIDFTRCCNVGC